MDQIQQEEVDQIGGIAVSHTALICGLISVLERRGVLNSVDVDEIFEIAAKSLEDAERDYPLVGRNARRQLDNCARNFVRRLPKMRIR